MNKLSYFITAISAIALICDCQKEVSPDNIPFTTPIKSDSTIILLVNDTFKIKINPVNAKVIVTLNADNTYKSPKNGVISLLPNDILKALEPGKVSVVIKNNSCNTSFNIIVVGLPVKLQLKDSSILVKTGRNIQLDLYQVFDSYETTVFGGLKWETIDKTVATVSDAGNITAINEGITKVRISLNKYPEVYSEYPVQVMNYIVYLLGQTLSENNIIRNSYWKNNIIVDSDLEIKSTTAQGFLYSNNNMYIVGRSSVPDRAFMLKNKTETIFSEVGAGATGVALMGEDVYICGYYTFSGTHTVALWKNSTLTPLMSNSEITSESIGNAIAVSGGNVFVGGYIKNTQGIQVACYWKNNQRTDLSDGLKDAIVYSIFVDGNDVYASGQYSSVIDNNINLIACYWKNGIRTNLISSASNANSIFVSNGQIFITGSYFSSSGQTACYWKNGEKFDLNTGTGTAWSNATGVIIADNNIFISGHYSNSNNKPIGCYWKNGSRIDLPPTNYRDYSGINVFPYSYVWGIAID